eukprot:TRINITY_DN317_c0_g1_i1.p1 TRINITY_DN317_c0_g1~~TRINITY_DN317_c0_g1_i1.p1  ORF type:complete len:165 (-),score=28.29 TRINITY_DN317_c0_g1_i1:81-575(-)
MEASMKDDICLKRGDLLKTIEENYHSLGEAMQKMECMLVTLSSALDSDTLSNVESTLTAVRKNVVARRKHTIEESEMERCTCNEESGFCSSSLCRHKGKRLPCNSGCSCSGKCNNPFNEHDEKDREIQSIVEGLLNKKSSKIQKTSSTSSSSDSASSVSTSSTA